MSNDCIKILVDLNIKIKLIQIPNNHSKSSPNTQQNSHQKSWQAQQPHNSSSSLNFDPFLLAAAKSPKKI